MSNSFASPPPLADPQTVVAGQPISYGAINSIGQTLNYAFGVGGITNAISQAWHDGTCSQSSTSYQEMCQWWLPQASDLHLDLEVYLLVRGTGSIRLTLDFGGSSDVQEIATSGGGESLYIQTMSLSSFGAALGSLTLEGKATTGTIKIASIMARWAPLTSPLPTSTGEVMGSDFVPFGIGRLDDEKPLSARVGYNMIRNINTLRKRLKTWVSWSAVTNADNTFTLGGPSEWLGAGDVFRLRAPVNAPWADTLLESYVYVAIKAMNVTSSFVLEVLGQEVPISANGWTFALIQLGVEPLDSDLGLFKLPTYRVGPDLSPANLDALYWDYVTTTPNQPDYSAGICGFCMWSE